MLHKVCQPFILATGLDISSTFEVQEVFAKWGPVTLLPAFFDRINDINQCCGVIVLCCQVARKDKNRKKTCLGILPEKSVFIVVTFKFSFP